MGTPPQSFEIGKSNNSNCPKLQSAVESNPINCMNMTTSGCQLSLSLSADQVHLNFSLQLNDICGVYCGDKYVPEDIISVLYYSTKSPSLPFAVTATDFL